MTTYKIAVIAGDGIGPEVIAEGIKVLEEAKAEWESYTSAVRKVIDVKPATISV